VGPSCQFVAVIADAGEKITFPVSRVMRQPAFAFHSLVYFLWKTFRDARINACIFNRLHFSLDTEISLPYSRHSSKRGTEETANLTRETARDHKPNGSP
jgi:hypothetical protein